MKILVCLSLLVAGVGRAAEVPNVAGLDLFERKIRPVLTAECYRCHSASAEKLRGGLLLDTREAMLTGGDNGAAIVPGNAAKSLLIKAIQGLDQDTAMPPKKALPAAVVADFVQWVQLGAPWPGASKGDPKPIAAGIAATYDKLRNELWSWQPIQPTKTPAVKNSSWVKSDLDCYVLAKLEANKLGPSPAADRLTLLRRATFDLTGLPPTPAEIDAFTKDESNDAFAHVVDRLLGSPHFGERWGRHWLDVARYADSTGMSRNFVYFYAWRYRNYVIDAFNNDKPYNAFVTEQLAGDLLPAKDAKEKDEHLIATGFLVVGPKDYVERNPQQFLANNVDEQIDATTRSLLATTVACARCHDHKFDPIPSAEYYSLAGIFRSTIELPGLDQRGRRVDKYSNGKYVHLSGFTQAELEDDDGGMSYEKLKDAKPAERMARAAAIRNRMMNPGSVPVKHFAMGVQDSIVPADAHVLSHGEVDQPGDVAPRGFLSIPCMGKPGRIPSESSGRLELAKWVTDPKNPLTARVMANRIWQHLFGEGLVKSVDNFGTTGEKPSNPPLLDRLAMDLEFTNQWSVKRTIREIMLSAVYQQSSAYDAAKFNADPENAMLWRMNQRRLEGEAIRDSILAASGKMTFTPPAGSITLAFPAIPLDLAQRLGNVGDKVSNTGVRSVYLPIFRNDVPAALEVFDMADPNAVEGSRDVTTVAPQALFMLNSEFVTMRAKDLALRVGAAAKSDPAKVELAYQLTLGRLPSAKETARAIRYLHQSSADNWAGFCQALFACAEFRYLN